MAQRTKLEDEDLADQIEWDRAFLVVVDESKAELMTTDAGRTILKAARALTAKLANTNIGRAA